MFHVHRPPRRRVRSGANRSIGGGGFGWLRLLLLTGSLGTLTTAGAVIPSVSLSAVSAQPQAVQPTNPAYPQPTQESALDAPLRMLAAARQNYQQIVDYQCILITQERVKGVLLPQNVMQMSFRKNPFSVDMKWLLPKEKEGQEVCYVQGQNQNKMLVRPAGAFGGLGFLKIDVNDPKVLENSRHTITEAGFGNLLDRCAKCWEAERNLNKTKVNIGEYEYNKKRCIRVELTHLEKHPSFYSYRTVLYFDKETWLPVRMETYDWPRQVAPPEGDLLECFSYVDVRPNVGLNDTMFTK